MMAHDDLADELPRRSAESPISGLEVVSFSNLESPSDDFLALPGQVERLSEEQATAERAGTRALLSPRNSYYQNAESICFVAYRDRQPVTRLAAFHNRPLGGGIGLVGLFASEHDPQAASAVVAEASGWLAERGLRVMRGPMAGDIWHRWRFMTRGFETSPFPGEPRQPEHYPELFESCGFAPVRVYTTKEITDLEGQLARFATAASLNRRRGYSCRPIDRSDWSGDLRRVCELCHSSFATNWCVTASAEEEFCDIYDRWLRRVGSDDIVLAVDPNGRVVGLGLAIKRPADTLNIRTIAILPDQHGFGLGQAIAAALYEKAIADGVRRVHHCLMGPLTPPQKWDHGQGSVTREYTMYERPIG